MKLQELIIKKCTNDQLVEILSTYKESLDCFDLYPYISKNLELIEFTIVIYKDSLPIALGVFLNKIQKQLKVQLDGINVPELENLVYLFMDLNYYVDNILEKLIWLIERKAYNNGYCNLCMLIYDNADYMVETINEMNYFKIFSIENLKISIYRNSILDKVSKFNKTFFDLSNYLEGMYDNANDLILEGINLQHCYNSEISITTTGDVLEYYDTDSGKSYYGLLIKKFIPMVLVYFPEKACILFMEFNENIGTLRLRNVLVNTYGGFRFE